MWSLVGDRFVRDGEGRTFDLGSGRQVWLEERRAADGEAMRRWQEASAHLMARWHSHLASLVDAFALAEDRFLVAYPYAPERPGAARAREVAAAEQSVEAFLRAQGLSVGGDLRSRARVFDGVVRIQPDAEMGAEAAGDAEPRVTRRRRSRVPAVGVRLAPFEAIGASVAAIECLRAGEVAPLFVAAPRGAGYSTFLAQVTREIRRLGIVPVNVLAWRCWPEVMALLRGRTIALVAEGEDLVPGRELRCAITAWAASSARLAAIVARVAPGHASATLTLAPIAGADLVSRLWVSDAIQLELNSRRALRSIVEQAEGLPGIAIERLLRGRAAARVSAVDPPAWEAGRASSWAAEAQMARFSRMHRPLRGRSGAPPSGDAVMPASRTSGPVAGRHARVGGLSESGRPLSRGSARVRVRGEPVSDPFSPFFGLGPQAEALIRRRRWASSARSLHRDVAAFSRRNDHVAAARSALALGRVRLAMADASSALRWFREALAHALADGADVLAAHALAWQGLARVDEAEMEEGEEALRCAWMVARHGGERALEAWVRVGLARCLYWQGRFSDMPLASDGTGEEGLGGGAGELPPEREPLEEREPPNERAPQQGDAARGDARAADVRLAVRVDLVRGQLGRAAARLAEGARRVERLQDADAASALDGEAARLHLLIGDLDASDRYLKDAMARRCARSRMLRLYLILYQRLLRESSAAARRRRERLAQILLRSDTPRLLRIRARYWIERPRGRWSSELRRFVARYGEAALAGGAGAVGGEPMWEDLQALLQISHEGTDEREALGRICVHVRERIGAARVAVHVAVDGAGLANDLPLVHAGSSRLSSASLARRILDTGLLSPVSAGADGLEAGVPVRYGATILGAIIVRWTVGARPDERLVTMVLMTMGAVAAPMVQAIRERYGGVGEAGAGSSAVVAGTPALLGRSAVMEGLRQTIRRVASAPFHVLVHGESGSGKELVARALHHHSPRRHRRFCAINCAALADELFEAEMFGHTRGAFTGALVERQGLFEEADGGTLFLDEVGELSARGQAKLLRVMQDGEVRRIGENLPRRVDARIVAATNRVLKEEVRRGQFRADLLYRLDVIHLEVPPLRERREDIPLLARAFWDEAARKVGSRATLAAETVAALARYDWPGNVRELQNALMALAARAGPRGRVLPDALSSVLGDVGARAGAEAVPFVQARRAFEARIVRAALVRSGGAAAGAARELGLTRQGLAKVMTRLGIEAVE